MNMNLHLRICCIPLLLIAPVSGLDFSDIQKAKNDPEAAENLSKLRLPYLCDLLLSHGVIDQLDEVEQMICIGLSRRALEPEHLNRFKELAAKARLGDFNRAMSAIAERLAPDRTGYVEFHGRHRIETLLKSALSAERLAEPGKDKNRLLEGLSNSSLTPKISAVITQYKAGSLKLHEFVYQMRQLEALDQSTVYHAFQADEAGRKSVSDLRSICRIILSNGTASNDLRRTQLLWNTSNLDDSRGMIAIAETHGWAEVYTGLKSEYPRMSNLKRIRLFARLASSFAPVETQKFLLEEGLKATDPETAHHFISGVEWHLVNSSDAAGTRAELQALTDAERGPGALFLRALLEYEKPASATGAPVIDHPVSPIPRAFPIWIQITTGIIFLLVLWFFISRKRSRS